MWGYIEFKNHIIKVCRVLIDQTVNLSRGFTDFNRGIMSHCSSNGYKAEKLEFEKVCHLCNSADSIPGRCDYSKSLTTHNF